MFLCWFQVVNTNYNHSIIKQKFATELKILPTSFGQMQKKNLTNDAGHLMHNILRK